MFKKRNIFILLLMLSSFAQGQYHRNRCTVTSDTALEHYRNNPVTIGFIFGTGALAITTASCATSSLYLMQQKRSITMAVMASQTYYMQLINRVSNNSRIEREFDPIARKCFAGICAVGALSGYCALYPPRSYTGIQKAEYLTGVAISALGAYAGYRLAKKACSVVENKYQDYKKFNKKCSEFFGRFI